MSKKLSKDEARRNAYYLKTYGITLDQYNQMLEEQEHKCAICAKGHTEQRRLHVDHDHASGHVRGLLCSYCNLRVVGRHRDATIFRAAADYLDAPRRGWIVPPKKKRKRRVRRRRKGKNSKT